MTSAALIPSDYIASLPEEHRAPVQQLRQTIVDNLPKGFFETMSYGMIGYVVPHTQYPAGYHCDPKQPLPFAGLAARKNSLSLYHMGLYAMPELMEWFTAEYPKHSKTKLDMGKSCIRFKKPDQIPHALIGELMRKMTPEQWIAVYEEKLKK